MFAFLTTDSLENNDLKIPINFYRFKEPVEAGIIELKFRVSCDYVPIIQYFATS
jgi:hypothetical protein